MPLRGCRAGPTARCTHAAMPRLGAPPLSLPRWRALACAATSRARVNPLTRHAAFAATTTVVAWKVPVKGQTRGEVGGVVLSAPPGGTPRGRPRRACRQRLWCSRLAGRRSSPRAMTRKSARSNSRGPQWQVLARRGGSRRQLRGGPAHHPAATCTVSHLAPIQRQAAMQGSAIKGVRCQTHRMSGGAIVKT